MRDNLYRLLVGIALFYAASGASAQQFGSIAAPTSNVPGPGSLPGIGSGLGSSDDTERSWNIVPRIGITETLTDNVNLSSTNKQSDLISQITPGIRIDARTARLKMYFDYALSGVFYVRESTNNQTQNFLNAFGTLEAIDNWFFVDFSGNITQQIISPFGVQSPSSVNINNNLTETSTYRISPYIRGQLFGDADYFLRYNRAVTNSGANTVSDVDLSQWIGQIRGTTRFQNLNWVIDGSQQNTDYSQGRNYDDERIRATLAYRLLPDLKLLGSGGWESNNYQSISMESHTTNGFGFDWTPTERTQAYAFKERRFFGNGHNVNLSHRFPLSSIRYTDVRDVTFIPSQSSAVGLGTIFDQYYQQFESLIPDPIERSNYVRNILNQAGIAPNAQAVSDYLTNRPRVRRLQQLSLTLYGSRNSITFLAARSNDQALTLVGDQSSAISQASRVIQQGYTVTFSHRLSELTGLNVSASRQKNESGLTNVINNILTTYQIGITTRLGAKTFGALNARHSESDSDTSPYTENALIGTLTILF